MSEVVGTGIDYRRLGRQILTGVDVTAVAGEVLVVTGPSGSGKSSLLAVLAGLEPPTGGTVTLDGVPVRVGDIAVRRRMGLVLQGYGLVSVLTAAENVELVLQARGVPAAECGTRAAAALGRVGLADVADHLTEELSGGQQQRVAIARALVGEPDVLLADEPTAELDAANRELVLELLLAEAAAGRTVVLASHDREVADACDRELHLVDGRVAAPAASLPAVGAVLMEVAEPVEVVAAVDVAKWAGVAAPVRVAAPVEVAEPVPAAEPAVVPEPTAAEPARGPGRRGTGWERPDRSG